MQLMCMFTSMESDMLMNYNECIEKYGSDYQLKKNLREGNIYMAEKGIYSTDEFPSELSIITFRYPKAVLTGDSAFFYHGLTDVIPDLYHLATRRTDSRIRDKRVIQSFISDGLFDKGISEISYNNDTVRIYSLERMLIELMRFKARYPRDYYKEILSSYRTKLYDMDFGLIEEYAAAFSNGSYLMEMIDTEVI